MKTFGDLKSQANGKPLTELKGQSFEVTDSGTGSSEYQGQVQETGFVVVNGERRYTFSKVLIQQIKDTIQPQTSAGESVQVTLTEKKGKRGQYLTFS